MATTPEGKVKDRVKRILKKHGCYQFWPVQSGYGAATLDCIACCEGHFISIETKAPGKGLTPRQELTRENMQDAGATVFVIGEYKQGDKIHNYRGEPTILEEEYSGLGALEAWILMIKK